nr:type I-C CRISPR-associated protein Cas8c/Csd1 [Acuticoccus mangrovi]
MSALAAATLPDAPPEGYAEGKVSILVSLEPDGRVANVADLRIPRGKKLTPTTMMVPAPVKRTSGIAPNFLWDKTAYALGVTAGAGKRTAEEHAAFVARHEEWLAGTNDEGLVAFLAFLRDWSPERFSTPEWPVEAIDDNVVFCLESERRAGVRLHDRPAARALWARLGAKDPASDIVCLVTGERGPLAELHPSIKGVWGGQTAGGSIVSFNQDAFTSYGHEQGANAPVSQAAALAYTGVLNRFLAPGSGHRVQIGDASTVFWAEAADAAVAETAAGVFSQAFGNTIDSEIEAARVGAVLEAIHRGRPLVEAAPDLAEGVRFYVLGLAPNAARISIRFWLEDDFATLMHHYGRFAEDIRIEPAPRDGVPPLWRYLLELAPQGKRENVPPNLAGEVMRAILTGARYPQSLLAATLMRIRADRRVGPLRAGLVKALLARNHSGRPPVARDVDNPSAAYQLGRLFAVMEAAQYAALGRVNAPIGDRYYAAASSTPARVFAALMRGLKTHVSDARKRGRGGWIEPRVEEIVSKLEPDLPKTLCLEDQGRFALGYYHEKSYRPPETVVEDKTPAEGDAE